MTDNVAMGKSMRNASRVTDIILESQSFCTQKCAPRIYERQIVDRSLYDRRLTVKALTKRAYNPDLDARISAARIRAMELGLSPWPSASGWAPMDLPWKERRILIGIVEGVASLARWAHEIWLRDHPPADSDVCSVCGDSDCSA